MSDEEHFGQVVVVLRALDTRVNEAVAEGGLDIVHVISLSGTRAALVVAANKQKLAELRAVSRAAEGLQSSAPTSLLYLPASSTLPSALESQPPESRSIDKYDSYNTITDNDSLSDADAACLVYTHLTSAKYFGGCGIKVADSISRANKNLSNPKWHWVGGESVADIIILHNKSFEKNWLNNWSDNWFLEIKDMTIVQQHMGEQIAFHFAFLQFYLQALAPLAAFGAFAFLAFPQYSATYAVILCLWSVVFLAAWKKQEAGLADLWGVNFADRVDKERPEFIPDSVEIDSTSGQPILHYPFWKRWIIHAGYTLPAILIFAAAVIFVSVVILTTEVYTAEVYNGPNKAFVKLIPMIIYVLCLPLLQALYNALSVYITNLENSQSIDAHNASLTNKTFIITCLLTQLSLLLTGLVYIPASDLIMPYLEPLLVANGITHHEVVDATRNLLSPAALRVKVVTYSITNQILNQAVQVILPSALAWWATRSVVNATKHEARKGETDEKKEDLTHNTEEEDRELRFRIERAISLPKYSLYDDYAVLANQFALVVMFSSSWPLVALFCVANNFLDVRTTAYKISRTRRPIPHRTNSITPWTQIFSVLSVLGTLTTTLLTLLYHYWDASIPASVQSFSHTLQTIVIIILAEHAHFAARWIAEYALALAWPDVSNKSAVARHRVEVAIAHDAEEQKARAVKKIGSVFGYGRAERIEREAVERIGEEQRIQEWVQGVLRFVKRTESDFEDPHSRARIYFDVGLWVFLPFFGPIGRLVVVLYLLFQLL
ncbi:hypothetical protein HK100_012427 [Physocladia obscura]|uniref:Anoctamin transmembrane domain-containing protein n=1 Tax=Physocladia obscura TaxID=109957 RepID=A0AAD5XG92_9FUNG|nr:hypothetical protein HK100_012427 [Physocladia obscura]